MIERAGAGALSHVLGASVVRVSWGQGMSNTRLAAMVPVLYIQDFFPNMYVAWHCTPERLQRIIHR